jgi:hypothetical protein
LKILEKKFGCISDLAVLCCINNKNMSRLQMVFYGGVLVIAAIVLAPVFHLHGLWTGLKVIGCIALFVVGFRGFCKVCTFKPNQR